MLYLVVRLFPLSLPAPAVRYEQTAIGVAKLKFMQSHSYKCVLFLRKHNTIYVCVYWQKQTTFKSVRLYMYMCLMLMCMVLCMVCSPRVCSEILWTTTTTTTYFRSMKKRHTKRKTPDIRKHTHAQTKKKCVYMCVCVRQNTLRLNFIHAMEKWLIARWWRSQSQIVLNTCRLKLNGNCWMIETLCSEAANRLTENRSQ